MRAAGAEVEANQIAYSLLDRRPQLRMERFCAETGMKLLPYGVLAGGFLSDRYLGVPQAEARDSGACPPARPGPWRAARKPLLHM